MSTSADWQLEIRGLLTGAGTVYRIGPATISGLGIPPMKTADVELFGRDGSFGSPDFLGPRILIVEYVINQTSETAAIASFQTLATAWAPSTTNITIEIQLPGWHFTATGRPRGLELDLAPRTRFGGVIEALAEFHALDPTLTTI
jgi:hypothetical protein